MSIDSNIAAGKYVNTLSYPQTPSKPILPRNATAEQARAYADQMDAYGAAREDMRAQRDAYNAETHRLEQQFREDLEAEYDMKGHPKADKLYNMAWDMGHSSGYQEVANYYDDLHELITH